MVLTFCCLSFESEQWPYEAAAIAFEAIPRTLAQNCGVNVIRTMTALQGKASYPYYVCSGQASSSLFLSNICIFLFFSMEVVKTLGLA